MAHRTLRPVMVAIVGSILGCSPPNRPSTVQNSEAENEKRGLAEPPVATVERVSDSGGVKNETLSSDDVEFRGPEVTRYVECAAEQADTVLVVFLTVPEVFGDCPFRFPLRLQRERKFAHHSQGTHCRIGCGFGSSTVRIGLTRFTECTTNLALSAHWTARAGKPRGSFKHEFAVTVGDDSRLELDDGIVVRWRFEPPTAEQQE